VDGVVLDVCPIQSCQNARPDFGMDLPILGFRLRLELVVLLESSGW
jgi:hypothetical protein